jgi:diguanylate cyclase (GGDEF)-like protein
LAVVIWREWIPLGRAETLLLVTICAMPLPRQIWLYYMAGLADEQWLRLLGNAYWATSAVLVAVFIIGNRRRSLIAGAAVVLASVLIAAVGISTGLARGTLPNDAISYIAGSLIFLTVFLVLMSVATIMRDQWHAAINRAAVYSRWALTDKLTGLANRRAGTEILARQCAVAKRQGSPQSIIMGDLDGFKRVNDKAGHALGDAVLTTVAGILQAAVRETDAVMRWGGEEFLIIVSNSDLEGARILAERCRRAIESEPLAGERMTMTFGVAQYQEGDTRESLLARADANLYAGKKAGRNRVESRADALVSGELNAEVN